MRSRMAALDLAERVVGFRTWRVVDGRLWSPYIPRTWDERIMRAECYRGPGALIEVGAFDHAPDAAPHPDCGCGIYAYHLPPPHFSSVDGRGITGIVTAWGRLEEHADGVRAEMARIEALAVRAQWSDRQRWAVLELADRLDLDLVDDAELESVAARYGPPLSSELPPRPADGGGSPLVGRSLAAIRRLVGFALASPG
jgi:hypothetical protein